RRPTGPHSCPTRRSSDLGVCAVLKKTPGGGYALPGLRDGGKGWFCRPGKRSATRRNLQRPPIPPGLLSPVQRRIGAGNDFRAGKDRKSTRLNSSHVKISY